MSTYPNVPVVAWEAARPLYLSCASLYPEERLMMFPQMKAFWLWIHLKMILDTSLWSGTNCKRCTVTRDIHTKRSKDWTWITIQSFPGTITCVTSSKKDGRDGNEGEWRVERGNTKEVHLVSRCSLFHEMSRTKFQPTLPVPSLIPVSRRKCCVTSVRKVAKVTVVTRHYENGFVTNITSTPAQSEVQTTSFKIGQSKSYR